MTEPDEGARLIAQYRAAIEPSEARLEAILRDVSDPSARPRILERGRGRARPTPRRGLRLAVGGGLVALAAAAAVAWWISSTTRHATAVADDSGSQAPFGVQTHERTDEAARRVPAPERSGSVVVEPGAATGSDVGSSAAAPAPVEPLASGASRSRPRATKPGALARETALIERAEASLREDDAAGALAVLGEHAREFPSGSLTVEAAALRVIALCRQGKAAQGRGEAKLLERHAASRPYRERIRRACVDE